MKGILPTVAVVILTTWCGITALAAQTTGNDGADASQWSVFDLPPGPRPATVRASFHLLHINQIDDAAETFEFSGVLTLVWRDARQAFDPGQEGVGEKFYHGAFQFNELAPSWYPQVVLANASSSVEQQGVLLRVKPDGTSTLIQTINAVAKSPLNLRKYPFDQQRLEAIFQVLGFAASEVALAVEAGAATADLSRIRVPQWQLTDLAASSRAMDAPHLGTENKSSTFVLTMAVQRKSLFMLRLVIAPLMLVVMLSWSVFWMERSSLGDRMSVSFVGILTAVAYQIVVADILPQISYVTLMNGFLNFSLLLMGATVVVNLVVGACDKRGESKLGDHIDRRCRWGFPLAYGALLLGATAVAFIWL